MSKLCLIPLRANGGAALAIMMFAALSKLPEAVMLLLAPNEAAFSLPSPSI